MHRRHETTSCSRLASCCVSYLSRREPCSRPSRPSWTFPLVWNAPNHLLFSRDL
ncbi:hypothetical protein LINGRAHAP2_LOCUS6152 [Linum grandiflorum]